MPTIHQPNNDALIEIGFRLAGAYDGHYDSVRTDIEAALLHVIRDFTKDYRIAAILLAWIKVHGNYVIVEKLMKLKNKSERDAGESFLWLTLVAAWAVECGCHKWRKLIKNETGPVYLYDPEISESAISRKGLIPWLEPLGYRVPQNSFRIRESDVLTREELIDWNPQYRNRYLYGPSWRADIITAVQQGITIPAEISRTIGCSYEPAYRISHEYLMAAGEKVAKKELVAT
jgi:hypothetical protein